jgi:hypothetical protein
MSVAKILHNNVHGTELVALFTWINNLSLLFVFPLSKKSQSGNKHV